MATTTPSYQDYAQVVNDRQDLTVEQKIILIQTYALWLQGKSAHTHFLMQVTNCSWKTINYLLNSLVLKGALKKVDKYHTTIKTNQ